MFLSLFLFSLFFNSFFFIFIFILFFILKKKKLNILIISIHFKNLFMYLKSLKNYFFYFLKPLTMIQFILKNNWHPLSKRTSYFTFFFFCRNQSKKII